MIFSVSCQPSKKSPFQWLAEESIFIQSFDQRIVGFTGKDPSSSSTEIIGTKELHYPWDRIGRLQSSATDCRVTFLIAFAALLTYSFIKVDFLRWNHSEGALVNWTIALSIGAILSFLYTATCNAGVLVMNEDNSIENQDQLECQGWSYCAICKLFRPPGAKHCKDCGVCFEK